MQPLVLAIEPDLRQAAIVKRIIREKVLADVAVVDSRDAALEAMRTTVPDVLLLSTLLSPRDEDELIAHLRTLQHAEHLQTHTIPQLASSIGPEDVKPSKGLLSAFRRKKGAASAPSGCDPEMFADEVRTYLQRASEKKREIKEAGPVDVAARPSTPRPQAPAPVEAAAVVETDSGSSWSSPFEWRPSQTATATSESPIPHPSSGESLIPDPASGESLIAPDRDSAISELFAAPLEPSFASAAPVDASPTAPVAGREFSVASPEFPRESPKPSRARGPLVLRNTREWWYEDTAAKGARPAADWAQIRVKPQSDARKTASDAGFDFDTDRSASGGGIAHDAEMQALLACLAVPATVAGVCYAQGCRIRRVRLTA